MSYNQNPQNPKAGIYVFVGVIVSVYAFLGGAQIYSDSHEIGILFILAVLVLYWGMPFFVDAYRKWRANEESDDPDTASTSALSGTDMPGAQQAGGEAAQAERPAMQIYLIDCPACGRKVSNCAHACPNCGHPIADGPQKS